MYTDPNPSRSRRTPRWWLMSMIGLLAILAQSVSAQTTLISPTGDGGFENGTTFAANGWTVVNGGLTNQWFVGTVPSGFTNRSAYISNDGGVTNAYTNTAPVQVHFWRDVTFPAGETNVTLSFDWQVVGETGFWDAVMVYVAPTSYTPTASNVSLGTGLLAAPAVNITSVWSTGSVVGTQTRTVSIPASVIGNCSGPVTLRLFFTWKNDTSGGVAPVAIDNISLTSSLPTSPITSAGGTFTINNTLPTGGSNFATFTEAVNALNAGGGCGFTAPLVFNVSAGQTFNENVPAITVSGNAVNSITFQKSGAGANPVITPSGSAGANDAGITITGGDYITFNGIDINSLLNAAVEYGYLVRNASATDGAQFNVIQNCTITLNRSNTTSRGIMQTATTTGGGFSATAASGTNSNNTYRNFSIRNVYGGVFLNGTSTTWPDVGVQVTTSACGTFNSIGDPGVPNDIGNVTTTATYGIQATNQSDVVIRNNRINNVTTSGAQVDGINLITFSGTCDVSNNIVGLIRQNSTTSLSLVSGIRATHNTTGSHTLRMYNNVVSGITSGYTTSTATRLIRGIYLVSTTGTTTYDIWHNNVSITGTSVPGSSACFETTTTSTAATLVVRNNVFANYSTNLNTTGRHFGVVHTSSATVLGAGASIASNNAIHIPNDVGVTGFTALSLTTNRNTAADWGGAVVQAAGNINADPIYVNVETNLTPQSPALNGTGFSPAPAYLTIDANCAARGNDIGAYEFNPPSCFPPTGTVVYVQNCGSNQFFLDVTVTNLSGGPGVNVVSNYPGNPGADFGVGLGTYQIGPFPSNTNVVVTLERVGDPTCDVSLGTYNFDCATNGQNALHFDGVNDVVNCGTGTSVNITGTQITLEAWIYPTAWRTSSFEGTIINKESLASQGYMLRCGNNGQLSFAFGNGTSFPEVQSAVGTLTLNTWQHVAATYDGTTMRIYRNGVQVGSLANTTSIASSPVALTIGSSVSYPARTFAGRIDEVRIWNVARSAGELGAFQNLELCGIENGLAAYYRFNQGTAGGNNAGVTTLPDVTANANNGTVSNMALTGPTSNWVLGVTNLTPCLACAGAPTGGTITGTAAVCAGTSNVLTATGAGTGLGITYQWKYRANGSSDPYTNLGTTLSQNTSSLPFGVWEVVFDVICSNGPTTTSSAPFVFTAYQIPTASASYNAPVCAGQALNLTGTTDIGVTYAWTGPSGFTSTLQTPSIPVSTFGSAGTYSFVATSAAPQSCASAPGTVVVTIGVTPTVTVTPATIDICPGGSTTLTALGNATTPLEGVLSAIVGQSATILATIPTPSGFTDGNTGTNIVDGCLDMFDGGNQINTNLATGIAYTNGVVTNSASFGTGGRYFTRVIGSNVCGASPTMFVWAADINGLTSVSISGNNGADGGGSQNTATFNVTANGITYTVLLKRVFGAGDPSINQMFLIPQPNSATQTIGTTTDDSQQNILNLAGVSRFYYLLYAGASGALIDDAAATGIAQAFVNAIPVATGGTYAWSTSETTPAITVNAPGTYTVTFSLPNGCSATANGVVNTAAPLAPATFSPVAPEFCQGSSVNITATPTGGAPPYAYQWTDPNNNPAGTNATQAANIPGVWTVAVTDNCAGPAQIATVTVVEKTTPVVSASAGPACLGQALQLNGTVTPSADGFTWSGPNGFSSTLEDPTIGTVVAATGGVYTFSATLNGCPSAPTTTTVAVSNPPTLSSVTATPNPVCVGGTSQLNANASTGYGVTPITFAPVTPGGPTGAGPSGDDVVSGQIPIGFSFPFYGTNYTNLVISTNGFISFDAAPGSGCCSGQNIPNTSAPNNLVALCWEDLNAAAGQITYFNLSAPNRFVVNFNGVPYLSGSGSVNGQIILYENGVIEVHNTSITGGIETNTQGIENAAGTQATPVPGRNAAGFTATNDAYRFQVIPPAVTWSPSDFLSNPNIVNPVATNVGGTTTYTVTATANGCSTTGTVTLNVDPAPAADLTVVPNCANSQFSISVNVTATGTGSTIGLSYTVNGGTPTVVTGLPIGPATALGPFAATDEVNVTILHENYAACNVPRGNFYSGCPELIVCPQVLNKTYCYGNSDVRSWVFTTTTPGETVQIDFVSGTMAPGDVIRIYDGTDDTGASLVSGNFADLSLVVATSLSESIYMEVESDATGSCIDGNPAASVWVFEVQCNPTCVDPNAIVTTSADCANQQFFIDVDIIDLGDAPTVGLEYTVNAGQPDTIPGLGFQLQQIGPFPAGSTVQVRLLHEGDASCNVNFGNFTLQCPNNEPCEARPLTMNPNYTCVSTTPGDMTGTTLTAGITGGCTGVAQDVWYSFVATGSTHRITLGGNTTGLSYSLYTGASCSGPLTLHPGFACVTGATVTEYNGLTSGTTYYVRVSRTTVGTNVFTVCVSAPPASFIGQNALSFDATNDRVTCTNDASVNITGTAITLEAWIFPTAWRPSSFQGTIINKEGAASQGYMLRCGNNGQLSFAFGNGSTFPEVLSATGALTLNTWQHVAATYDGTTMRIFRDGVQIGSAAQTTAIAATTNPLTIGDYAVTPGTRVFAGKIDEVRVWNVVLSPAQLMANMNQQLCGGETGLRAYYQFNQGVDGGNNAGVTTLLDLSGFGNNGTLFNFALNGPTSNWVQGLTGMTACPPCASAPTAGTISGTATVCSGVAHNLNLLGATTGTGITYQWYYGPVGNPTANLLGTGLLQSTASIPPGTWQLVVDVTCAGFGTATTAPFTFTKNQTPTATVQLSSPGVCVGQQFSVLGVTDIGTTFAWTGPSGFTSTSQNAIVNGTAALSNAGTYSFTATANGCTSPAATAALSVSASPVITSLTATPNPVCEGTGTSQLSVVAPASGYTMSFGTFSTEPCQATAGPSGDDSVIPAPGANIGFSFTYFGVTYTNFTISTNGNLQLGNGSGTANNPTYSTAWTETAIPNAAVPNNMIAVAWDDWNASAGQITYGTTGTAPNRKLVVCFNNITGRGDGGTGTLNAQVVLEEGTNRIIINQTTINSSSNKVQGLEDATGSASSFAITGRNNDVNWSVSNETRIFTPNSFNISWSPATNLSAANIPNPVFGPAAAGSYPYTVTATNPTTNCATSSTITVNVNPALAPGQANITGNLFYCGTGSTTLTANATGGGSPYSYAWTNPNNAAAGTSQTVTANIAGTWSVTITDACGGTATASVNVEARPQPTASASASPACTGSSITLTGTTDIGTSFQWTGPNGFTSTDQNPTIASASSANSGVYTFVASLNGCSTTATVNVTVFDPPAIASVTATPPSVCTGLNSQLNASANSAPYVLVPVGFAPVTGTGTSPVSGDDSFSGAVAIGFPFTFYGNTYTNLYISTNGFITFDNSGLSGCCSGQVMPDGNAPNNVIALAWEDLNAAAGQITTYSLTSPNRFVVQFNNVPRFGGTGVVNGQIILYADGVIEMQITNITGGASDLTTQGIENAAGSQAVVVPGRNSSIWTAANQAFRFVPVTTTFSWSPATFLSSTTIANPVATAVTATTTYTVTVTGAGGCTSQGTVTVNVNPLPTVSAGTYAPICGLTAPAVALDQGSPAGGTYLGAGVSGPTGNQVFNPAVGTQTLTYSFTDGNGCSGTAQTTITVLTTDTDGDGIVDCADNCPNLFGQIGQACNAGPGFVIGVISPSCVCVGQQCTTDLVLEFQTDANANQISWELRATGTNILAQSGSGLPGPAIVTVNTCLPDGCYYLRVQDAGGDGIANGGYILRTSVGQQRIIDNRNNFTSGSVSAVIGNGGFCLPLGTDKLIYTSCDKLDWVNNQFIVASENPAVSAQWGNGDQTDDGYQFWWFDPNGSYGYSKFRSHATSDGFGPASATRACHARINNWSPNQIPANVLMNVKVRSRVNGVNSNWGPVCRFKIDPIQAACPLTKLMDIPGNAFFSCGVTRTWGGSSRIHARPVEGATQYQFRFTNGELAAPVVRTTTTYYLNLNWTPALANGTYDVQVRAYKNGAWCVTSLPWGDVCTVTITGSTAMTLPGTGSIADAELAMFPNPNNGDQLTLSLSAVEEGVQTVSVDIFDLNGARVVAKVIPVNDGMIYQQMAVSELASGVYLVNITAGSKRYTERLVITK